MHHISLHLSPKQASKLRNGHKVRVKKGEGFNLLVHPTTYDIVSRAFRKGKGAEIALSPEEIELNKAMPPEAHQSMKEANPKGAGLFKTKKGGDILGDLRRAFDPRQNGVAKAFEPVAKALAPAVPVLKTVAKEAVKEAVPYAVDYGKDILKSGITTTVPVAAPLINRQIDKYADKGKDKLTNYAIEKIGSGIRRKRGMGLSTGEFGIIALSSSTNLDYLRDLDERTGSHYSNMARSTLENAKANEMSEYMTKLGINERREGHNIMGNGVRVMPREGQYMPQALMSQPLSANYHFRHFFPVNFQNMVKDAEEDVIGGEGLGLGLYL